MADVARKRECMCPQPNPDCQHPTCPRYPQPGHLEAEAVAAGLPTENARRYAREFAAEQLRKAAKWAEANGYDEAAVDHLIVKALELWPGDDDGHRDDAERAACGCRP